MALSRSLWPILFAALIPGACTDSHTSPDATTTHPDATSTQPDATSTQPDGTPADQTSTSPDAASDGAVASPDGSTADVAPTGDAGPAGAECAAGVLVDLNARGMLTDNVTSITIATDSAAAMGTLPAPSCQSDVGHPLVFRYTTRTTATLRVSTNNDGTTFDTVAWALDRCVTSGSMELGCGDDDNMGTHENASTFTTSDHVMAGQTIYIVVAGMGGVSGTVELTVAELRDVANGAACDPTGATTICATLPATCVTSGGMSVCEAPQYTETGVAPPVFIDACTTGTHVALTATGTADARDTGHASAGITLPFAFNFFGTAVHAIWPSTNGYAVFDAAPTDNAGGDGSIPMPEEGPVVAPFWQDLTLRAAPGSDICWLTSGTAPNRTLALEWLDVMPAGDTTTHVTFEAVLTEGTNAIDFVYQTITPGDSDPAESDGSWSVIGLQSNNGVRFVTHDGSVDTMDGIHWAPGSPSSP